MWHWVQTPVPPEKSLAHILGKTKMSHICILL
jgi:hypothetical protein